MTEHNLAETVRATADLVTDGVRYGVPEPATISVNTHTPPTLIMRSFEDVEVWSLYLDAPTTRSHHGDAEHIDVHACLPYVYGTCVRVTANRERAADPWGA